MTFNFEINSTVPILQSKNSKYLSYDTSTNVLTVKFESGEAVNKSIGAHTIKFEMTDNLNSKKQYSVDFTLEFPKVKIMVAETNVEVNKTEALNVTKEICTVRISEISSIGDVRL